MKTFVTVYNKQMNGPSQYVLVQEKEEEKLVSPVLYYWLKFHGKEELANGIPFEKETHFVVHEETEQQGENVIHHTYGKYFIHFVLTPDHICHLPDLSLFLEFFHSDACIRKEMIEKIGSSLEQITGQKNKFYMDAIAELVRIYKKFLAR